MAACHLRSISLPSTSHPLVSSVEEQLNKLKASESLTIGYMLSGLKEFYECIHDLLQLPHAQQALSHQKQSQCVEEALESIVFNKLQANCVSCEGKFEANDVEKTDKELLALKSSKATNAVRVQDILKGLEALESSLQEAVEELECVYRRLVKTRVSLLNILNH